MPLNFSNDCSVELDSDIAYLGEPEFVGFQGKACLSAGEAIVPTIALEPRIARTFTCFGSTEESLVCQIN